MPDETKHITEEEKKWLQRGGKYMAFFHQSNSVAIQIAGIRSMSKDAVSPEIGELTNDIMKMVGRLAGLLYDEIDMGAPKPQPGRPTLVVPGR